MAIKRGADTSNKGHRPLIEIACRRLKIVDTSDLSIIKRQQ
jgi:hypothetical protein